MNKNGFTLLEVIIVIIIIGVLAALALPRYQKLLEGSTASEAIGMIGTVRRSIERCFLRHGNYALACGGWDALDIEDPSNAPGSHFNYLAHVRGGGGYSNTYYWICATRKNAACYSICFGEGVIFDIQSCGGGFNYPGDGKLRWAADEKFTPFIPNLN